MAAIDMIHTASSFVRDRIPLPDGVQLRPLMTHRDDRGSFTEIFREQWMPGSQPRQWNLVHSAANVLRGVHAHRRHVDCLTMAMGEMVLGLHDMRPASPTHGLSSMLRLQALDLHLAVVPVGVAHGFYFPEPACHVYAVSEYFDERDEFGCRWNETALGLVWPSEDPILSERDRAAGSYADMVAALEV